MNKLTFLFIAFLLTLMTFSCNRKSSPATTEVPKLGDTLSLALNTTLAIPGEDLKLTFMEVQDSRCPRDMNCIRAGEAIATIKFERPGVKQVVKLEAAGGCEDLSIKCGEEKLAIGFRVQLLNIYPYPEDGPKPKKPPVPEAKLIIMDRD